jgi:hypothetical protein
VANSNDRIEVIRVEELHGKNAASLEKLEHGNARKFPKRATSSQDQRRSGLTDDDRPMAGNKDSVVFTLMASWWRGLDDDGLTIGIALVAAVIVRAAIDEIWGIPCALSSCTFHDCS